MAEHELTTDKGRKVRVIEDANDELRIFVDGGPHSVRYDQSPYAGSDGGHAVVLKLGAPVPRGKTGSKAAAPTT